MKCKIRLVKRKFELGRLYFVYGRKCIFIQTTNKGYNFLDVERYETVFKKGHFYLSRKHKGKFLIPDIYVINEIPFRKPL